MMNKEVLTEQELRSVYSQRWMQEFQNADADVYSCYRRIHKSKPPYEFVRDGLFQFYRWAVANRGAKLMYRPSTESYDEIPVQDVEAGFKDWWDQFPKREEDTNVFLLHGQEPYYDLALYLLGPETNRYTIEWDPDAHPKKFGDDLEDKKLFGD